MARMPLDPRISRMLIEARGEGCLREVAVIAAALSIRDPRERPPEKAAQADAMHAPFRDPDSDFLTLLNIWDRFHGDFEELKALNQKRKFCHDHFLSFPRMREWVFVHAEILDILQELQGLRSGRSGAGREDVQGPLRRHPPVDRRAATCPTSPSTRNGTSTRRPRAARP